jgi:hypothetical protein
MEPTKVNLVKSPGMLALAAFLILSGLNAFLLIGFLGTLAAILAIVAGVLLLIGK